MISGLIVRFTSILQSNRRVVVSSCFYFEAYLDEACQGDAPLRSQVDALLRSADIVGGFLETPAVVEQFDLDESASSTEEDVLNFLSPSEAEGSLGRIGHFEVQSVLGEGGAGVVLKTLDSKLNRHGAIKVLSPLIAVNRKARMRFIGEAHAAAAISHPHATAIHGIDEHNQLPYLVLWSMRLRTGWLRMALLRVMT
jgi:hypothetical protein